MTSRIYALEGIETNIYFENIIVSNVSFAQLEVDITSSKGKQMARCWRYHPTGSDGGTAVMQIFVRYNGILLAFKELTVCTALTSSGISVARKVNSWGDSTLATGQPLSIIITDQVGDPMALTMVGTKGTAPNQHEGRAGYRLSDYATAGRTLYQFNVARLDSSPGVGSIWINDNAGFVVKEINLSDGTGYFRCERTFGVYSPRAVGILKKSSGSGPDTISYSSYSVESGNPMWDGSVVNYGYYLTTNSLKMAPGDWFTIAMGINDVFNITHDEVLADSVNKFIVNLRTIIDSVHNTMSGIRCLIMVPIPPSISQDAFGENYNNGQTLARYWQNIIALQSAIIATFDNNAERSAGNYLLPYNAVVDRVNSFPFAMRDANRRSTETVRVYINGVHPAQTGYDQMGDQLRAFLKYMV